MGAKKMAGKRKSPCDPSEWTEVAVKAAAEEPAAASGTSADATKKPGKRFVGVRQRPSGRWVAEIKDTIQKIRVWLGTFDTAEAAARAYDEAACLLRGANTRTNFWPRSPPHPSAPPALPAKISSLLVRLKAKNSSKNSADAPPPSSSPCASTTIDFSAASTGFYSQQVQQQHQYSYSGLEIIDDFRFSDFLNDQSFFTTTTTAAPATTGSVTTSPSRSSGDDSCYLGASCTDQADGSQGGSTEEEGPMDFSFVDSTGWSSGLYSPFEMAEEVDVGPVESMDEPVRRMTYERRISASLYALNGVSECLRLRRDGGVADHLRELSNSCKKQRQDGGAELAKMESQQNPVQLSSSSSSSSSPSSSFLTDDGELSMWSSLDLTPLCWLS